MVVGLILLSSGLAACSPPDPLTLDQTCEKLVTWHRENPAPTAANGPGDTDALHENVTYVTALAETSSDLGEQLARTDAEQGQILLTLGDEAAALASVLEDAIEGNSDAERDLPDTQASYASASAATEKLCQPAS